MSSIIAPSRPLVTIALTPLSMMILFAMRISILDGPQTTGVRRLLPRSAKDPRLTSTSKISAPDATKGPLTLLSSRRSATRNILFGRLT